MVKRLARRDANWWAPLNQAYREFIEVNGCKPDRAWLEGWFEQHAAATWPNGDQPSVQHAWDHCKCLRTLDQARDYFRAYRARKKDEKDLTGGGGGSAPNAAPQRRRSSSDSPAQLPTASALLARRELERRASAIRRRRPRASDGGDDDEAPPSSRPRIAAAASAGTEAAPVASTRPVRAAAVRAAAARRRELPPDSWSTDEEEVDTEEREEEEDADGTHSEAEAASDESLPSPGTSGRRGSGGGGSAGEGAGPVLVRGLAGGPVAGLEGGLSVSDAQQQAAVAAAYLQQSQHLVQHQAAVQQQMVLLQLQQLGAAGTPAAAEAALARMLQAQLLSPTNSACGGDHPLAAALAMGGMLPGGMAVPGELHPPAPAGSPVPSGSGMDIAPLDVAHGMGPGGGPGAGLTLGMGGISADDIAALPSSAPNLVLQQLIAAAAKQQADRHMAEEAKADTQYAKPEELFGADSIGGIGGDGGGGDWPADAAAYGDLFEKAEPFPGAAEPPAKRRSSLAGQGGMSYAGGGDPSARPHSGSKPASRRTSYTGGGAAAATAALGAAPREKRRSVCNLHDLAAAAEALEAA